MAALPPPPPPVVILVISPEHVAVAIPAATKKKAPSAWHVAVAIPASATATKKKMSPPKSPLVRALVKGVAAASLLLGAPALFVAALVTQRPFPFVHLIGICVCVFVLSLHFQFREEEDRGQAGAGGAA